MHKANHLAQETSPYLQQHANNPVDWRPWNKSTLNLALSENKPILLSIGYAACHWCHVMAHESFEDEETAILMNDLFINIKVDREERPDLDKIYQTAHYFLTQHAGGWPLTVFLTPDDLSPFFSGTYFPPEARYQLPSFKDILRKISNIYKNHPHDIKNQNTQLISLLNHEPPTDKNIKLTDEPLKLAQKVLQERFDKQYGGFGNAPKFPQPMAIEFLLQNKNQITFTSLLQMAKGGLYDQIQGGFFRYSVDEKWEIPHFEKMLYDNAQLLYLYALASHQFNDPYFAKITQETADWVISTMQSPEGGYYSSLDADSDGHEGKFYVWDKLELANFLTTEEMQFAEIYFNLAEPANFENKWHLHIADNLAYSSNKKIVDSIKLKLLTAREKRIYPFQDQKILTAWNALMIKGMAIAGDILKEPRYITSAQHALEFIQQHLWVNNRLLVSCKDNKASLPAYLDDYAFLLDAILTVLQISWNTKYLEFAIQLAENILLHFSDINKGGFFFTADDQETVIYRPKVMSDDAIPAGNAIAGRALMTLGHLLGEPRYLIAAEKILQAAWSGLSQFPAEHCSMLFVLKNQLTPVNTIIIRGEKPGLQSWLEICKNNNYTRNEVFAISNQEKQLPGLLSMRQSKAHTCAYICQGEHCLSVINTSNDLIKNLQSL